MANVTMPAKGVEISQSTSQGGNQADNAQDLLYNQNTVTNHIKGVPYTVSMVQAAGTAANIALVTMTVNDETGSAVTYPVNFDWWLSDVTTGIGLTSTAPSSAAGAGTTGTDLSVFVSKKATRSQTGASGVYILSVTDTNKTSYNVCAQVYGVQPSITTLATATYHT